MAFRVTFADRKITVPEAFTISMCFRRLANEKVRAIDYFGTPTAGRSGDGRASMKLGQKFDLRNNALNAWRLILAAGVIVWHCWPLTGRHMTFEPAHPASPRRMGPRFLRDLGISHHRELASRGPRYAPLKPYYLVYPEAARTLREAVAGQPPLLTNSLAPVATIAERPLARSPAAR